MLNRLLAKQLASPSGIPGAFVGHLMNSVNRKMNSETVAYMDVQKDDTVLDIGFGGGITLALLVKAASSGLVVGMEKSKISIKQASRTYKALIQKKQMKLIEGSVESIPFEDKYFDKICTVNTIYFWENVKAGLAEINRVLKPDGAFVLSFRPAKEMKKLPFTRYGFSLFEQDSIAKLLENAGFKDSEMIEQHDGHLEFVCSISHK